LTVASLNCEHGKPLCCYPSTRLRHFDVFNINILLQIADTFTWGKESTSEKYYKRS
jgi:hypothetical protein